MVALSTSRTTLQTAIGLAVVLTAIVGAGLTGSAQSQHPDNWVVRGPAGGRRTFRASGPTPP